MKMRMFEPVPDKALVDISEFQRTVLEFIVSEEFDKMTSSTIFEDDPKYRSAIIHGMAIAAMLTSRCDVVYAVTHVCKED